MPLKLFRRNTQGNWYIRGTVAGCRVYESTGTSQRRLAQATLDRRQREIAERAAFGRAATTTFAEAALTYIEAGGEARFLTPILEYAGADTLLFDIDNAWLTEAARAIYPSAKPATVDRQLVTPVSAIYNLAAEDNLCPARRFRKRAKDNARIHWLTPEEAERLIAAIRADQPHILRPVAIMLSGGARTGETFPIRREALNIPTGEIWIPETKNDIPRYVRLPRRGLDLLLEGGLPEAGEICRTHRGKPYAVSAYRGSQIRAAWKSVRKAAGLGPEITPHVLRHTWATWYYAATKDFGGLMDFGGWKTPDIANRYRKLAPEDLPERLVAHGWDFSRADYRPQSVVPFRAQARG